MGTQKELEGETEWLKLHKYNTHISKSQIFLIKKLKMQKGICYLKRVMMDTFKIVEHFRLKPSSVN